MEEIKNFVNEMTEEEKKDFLKKLETVQTSLIDMVGKLLKGE